jgi:hypothetical protein
LLPEGLTFNPATATISGTPVHAGEYDIVLAADNAIGTGTARFHLSVSQSSPPPFTLANISTRVQASASSPGIGGFIIQGSGTKRVIVRALGPSLASAGIASFLTKPELELHDASGSLIAYNFRWPDTQWLEIENTGLTNLDFDDAVIVQDLAPGAYTAVVKGYGDASGIALVEVYDLDSSSGSTLANISTRGRVGVGDNVMIAGFILAGAEPTKVLLRALGPDLTAHGVAGALQNPALELYNGNGVLIDSNDSWRTNQAGEITATGLVPGNNSDAAILATLTTGNYTAIVRGVGGTSGVALVEVYNIR